VLEFPWKLIRLGEKERYLFDTTTPEGETKNLLAQHPDIVARLEAKLAAWTATLQPPGLPEKSNEQDNTFFATHVDKTAPATTGKRRRDEAKPAATPADTSGNTQGWQVRNGTLAVQGGALVIAPEANSKRAPFLTRAALDLAGPLHATLRLRAKTGGPASLTWRAKGDSDFLPANRATFDWPASAEWREVKVELPVQGRLIHLRISLTNESTGLEIQSIELRGPDEKAQTWRFDSAP
jgi:hypothetical protein